MISIHIFFYTNISKHARIEVSVLNFEIFSKLSNVFGTIEKLCNSMKKRRKKFIYFYFEKKIKKEIEKMERKEKKRKKDKSEMLSIG